MNLPKSFLFLASLIMTSIMRGQITYPTVETFSGTGVGGLFDASLLNARFDGPYGVCYEPVHDAIYVADGFNHCIRKLQNGVAYTVAGNGIPGDIDGVGINARFNNPTGVFYKDGYLYICDDLNHKIKRMDSLYNVTTIAGSGIQGFADGPAMSAAFYQPKSLCVDDNGVVYVADYENHRIRKIEGGNVTTVAGNGIAGDGLGPALSISLHRPRDLCIDPAGNVYFVDLMNHRVKVLTTGGTVDLVAGSGIQGNADGIGVAAQFSIPVAIDWEQPGVLMVLDAIDPLLRRVSVSGLVETVAGSGGTGYIDGPSATAEFDLPQDICFDNQGRMYVGDRDNDVIRVLYPHGWMPTEVNQPVDVIHAPPPTLPIHPTPTASLVTIDVSGVADPLSGLLVYDERGALVLRMEEGALRGFGQGAISIDVAHWPAGSYAVLVSTRSRVYRSTIVR